MYKSDYEDVKYDSYSALITFAGLCIVIYLLGVFMDERPSEFKQLSWLLVGSFIILGFSYMFSRFPTGGRLSKEDLARIASFTLLGFLAVFGMMLGTTLGKNVVSRYAILTPMGTINPALLTKFYVSIAAIFEENFRYGALRFLAKYELPVPMVGKYLSGSVVVAILWVNFIWTSYHARSYIGVDLSVWIGLYLAGLIISVFLLYSEHLLVAILIHLAWNLMVVL